MNFARRSKSLILIGILVASLTGCGQKKLEMIDVPENVVALDNEVIAFRVPDGSEKYIAHELPIEKLSKKAAKSEDIFLLYYADGIVTQVKHLVQENKIVADLLGGETYLMFAKPTVRLQAIYGTLCVLDLHRESIDRINSELFGRICPLVLCAPELTYADDLSVFQSYNRFQAKLISARGKSVGGQMVRWKAFANAVFALTTPDRFILSHDVGTSRLRRVTMPVLLPCFEIPLKPIRLVANH